MKWLLIFILFAFVPPVKAGDWDKERFFVALGEVESNNNVNVPPGDNGKALGIFQIHRGYWYDATHDRADGQTHPGEYKDVIDPAYARQVVEWHMERYRPDAWETGDLEVIAKKHHHGTPESDAEYWKKFQAAYARHAKATTQKGSYGTARTRKD